MLNEIFNYMNCCKKSEELGKLILKEEKEESTNDSIEKNKIPLNEEMKKSIIKNENRTKESIITFSDTKVKENKIKKRILDTLVIGSREINLEGNIRLNSGNKPIYSIYDNNNILIGKKSTNFRDNLDNSNF